MTEIDAPGSETAVTACCADFYASDLARSLLGESFHPGGIELTSRLGELLQLNENSVVLDVATGRGVSAIYMAECFGCRVIGIDYSDHNIARANAAADSSPAADQLMFITADALRVPVRDESIDAIICECSLCTFPDKHAAAQEFFRVLRPGGRIGISDLTVDGELPGDLSGRLAHVLCIANALPITEYVAILEGAGFTIEQAEQNDQSLRKLVADVRARLVGAKILMRTRSASLRDVDLEQWMGVARAAASAVEDGTLGYALITAKV